MNLSLEQAAGPPSRVGWRERWRVERHELHRLEVYVALGDLESFFAATRDPRTGCSVLRLVLLGDSGRARTVRVDCLANDEILVGMKVSFPPVLVGVEIVRALDDGIVKILNVTSRGGGLTMPSVGEVILLFEAFTALRDPDVGLLREVSFLGFGGETVLFHTGELVFPKEYRVIGWHLPTARIFALNALGGLCTRELRYFQSESPQRSFRNGWAPVGLPHKLDLLHIGDFHTRERVTPIAPALGLINGHREVGAVIYDPSKGSILLAKAFNPGQPYVEARHRRGDDVLFTSYDGRTVHIADIQHTPRLPGSPLFPTLGV